MNKFLLKRISTIKYLAIILMSLVSILFISIIIFEKNDYEDRLSFLEKDILTNFEGEYDIVLYFYRQLSNSYYNNIIKNNRILKIIKDANNLDVQAKNKLRSELIDLVEDEYLLARESDFRQYHFVLRDNTSFLRMHKKEKFGDDLSGVRYTVEYVNNTGDFIEGFEEGRIFNGYRFEYPLYYKGEFIGAVEVSMSYESISNMMDKLFNTKCIFLMKKDIVDEKVWKEEFLENYSKIDFIKNYYIDNKTSNELSKKSIMSIKDKTQITKLMQENKNFIIHSEIDKKDYCNGFILIRNVKNDPAAYLIFSNRCDSIYDLQQVYFSKILLFVFLWLLLLAIVIIIVQNRINIEKINSLDKLTGAYNRNLLCNNIQEEINSFNKKGNSFYLVLVDVDDFKLINDLYGHLVGDKVLINVVEIFKKELKNKGYVFRYGGDEFLIILNLINKEDAISVANKLKEVVKKANIIEGESISLSMGLVNYNDKLETIEELINRADACLYKSKQLGKNRVYSED